MSKTKKLPARSQVKADDTWDLSSLYPNDEPGRRRSRQWEKQIRKYEKFRGTLGESPAALAKCLKFDSDFDRVGRAAGHLRLSERRPRTWPRAATSGCWAATTHAATHAAEASSFIRPEILAIPARSSGILAAKPLAPFRLQLERLMRYKPHTLSRGEEKLLAMQSEMAGAAEQDVPPADRRRSEVRHGAQREGRIGRALATRRSRCSCIRRAATSARRRSISTTSSIKGHENSLAAAYSSSVQKDVYYAKARNYPSAREASLFHDNVPVSRVRQSHRGRARQAARGVRLLRAAAAKMKLQGHSSLRHLRADPQRARHAAHVEAGGRRGRRRRSRRSATTIAACSKKGSTGRWCDRYPNQGKQSGAFS